jgi:hypothetical protein
MVRSLFSKRAYYPAVAAIVVIALNGLGCNPRPSGNGWRTAQWNVCTTATNPPTQLECRSKINASDAGRTAAQKERDFIAANFLEDENMYSFTLQEICEQDARWIAAYVANGGRPADGLAGDYTAKQYEKINRLAPYAFLPYMTHEMLGNDDNGCGVGISRGIAAIAKRVDDTNGLKLRGLTNEDYHLREDTGMTQAQMQTPSVCQNYFQYQTTFTVNPNNEQDNHYYYTASFEFDGCTTKLPVPLTTLRGTACVRTRWQGPGDATHYRVSTCSTHAVHKGAPSRRVRNHQIDEAATMTFSFADDTNQRVILSGDFNTVANRNEGSSLNKGSKGQGHLTILSHPDFGHGLIKVTEGVHISDPPARTGTFRSRDPALTCVREIDGIYVKNWAFFNSANPNTTLCTTMPSPTTAPDHFVGEWSDHEMMVSPLMSPHP